MIEINHTGIVNQNKPHIPNGSNGWSCKWGIDEEGICGDGILGLGSGSEEMRKWIN